MEKEIIYNNGEIKLKHLTRIKYRTKLDNRIMDGIIIGQQDTQFIVWTEKGATIGVTTHDIVQIAIISENEDLFIPLEEYKLMPENN